MKKLFYHTLFLIVLSNVIFGQEGKSYVFDEHGVPQVVNVLTEAEAIAQYPRLAIANTLTAANIFSANGAASTPALKLNGSIFTGGSSTTTKPIFLVEPSTATTTGWDTNGTLIGANAASGFTGRLIDLQLNGASSFRITGSGSLVTTASASLSANGAASTPGLKVDGSIFTGGTATTTTPQLLVEPLGTTSNHWSTSGTLIGANGPSGFSGRLIHLAVNASSTSRFYVDNAGNAYAANFATGTSSGAYYLGTSNDIIITRENAAVIQFGSDAASPAAYLLKGADSRAGTDTNTAGGSLTILGGRGTGTAAGGALILQTGQPTTTGTSAGTTTTREYFYAGEKSMTESSATTLVNIAFASGKYIGGSLTATTHADDATDFQATTEHLTFSAVNKAGTVTASIQAAPSSSTTATSSGTLSTTWTIVNNGASVDIKNNAVSSLTQTTLKVSYKLTLNSDAATTITP